MASTTRIINASKQRKDDIHQSAEEISTVYVHRKCVDKYCHPKTIQKVIRDKQKVPDSTEQSVVRTRRSDFSNFIPVEHCLFCGDNCDIQKDSKHPSRWRPAYIFRQNETHDKRDLKEVILEVCSTINNSEAEKIKIRLACVLTDLHAADVRYHVDCRTKFMNLRHIQAQIRASSNPTNSDTVDTGFLKVIDFLELNKSSLYNSVDLYNQYMQSGGIILSRRSLVNKLEDHFGGELITLSSPGLATMLTFKSKTAELLHMLPDESDDINLAIDTVAKKISKEIKDIEIDKENYYTHIDKVICDKFQSDTLGELLSKVSTQRLRPDSLQSMMIGNIVTSVVKNQATPLQITLALSLKDSKEHVQTFYDFGVTCSYDELRRYKRSVASAANDDAGLSGLVSNSNNIVQAVGDNYDQEIASQNGKIQTHSMALLLTQSDKNADANDDHETMIPRLPKSKMTNPIPYDVEIVRYEGLKKPLPPVSIIKIQVPPLAILARTACSLKRARERDFEFFQDVSNGSPEYNGYNTKRTREEGQSLQPKTKAIYLPLIDLPPAEYDTMLTSMLKIKELSENSGQTFTIFTLDQQLHNYAIQLQWALPDSFPMDTFFIRLGGMHTLMNLIGAIGNLMANTGLEDILSSAFAGVKKMLIGKKFPQCLRALRMVVEVILELILEDTSIRCYDDLIQSLENRANRSHTCRLWIDCLVKPMFIMMAFVRAERESDWTLHMACIKEMIPYFFSAGHSNYSRAILVYLRTIERLPADLQAHLLNEGHAMRHREGLWNGIPSDMFIESTFMRYGHGRAGIVGLTLKPETLKTWALSRHVCSQLMIELDEMRGDTDDNRFQKSHKEESTSRIENDKKDRNEIRKKVSMCIHPLDPNIHPDQLVNVATGSIAPPSVNVHKALSIGSDQVASFEKVLPSGYWNTIERRVQTMATMRKGVKIGNEVVYDTELIFSRVVGLQATTRDVDFKDVLSYELAPIPTALFDDSGEMRICKSKADLKHKTSVAISVRNTNNINCTILDGCAILWIIPWPASTQTNQASVSQYVTSFKKYILQKLETGHVYLVFDRYIEFSTKCSTRKARGSGGCKVFQLTAKSVLPPQNQILTIPENKRQLIDIIVKSLASEAAITMGHQHKIVVTGQDAVPIELSNGRLKAREDLSTTHEEGDAIVVSQAIHVAKERKNVAVIADDTDIYILLLYHYHKNRLTTPMIMLATRPERAAIDVSATVNTLGEVCLHLLPAHALTGCDQVALHHGIGKAKMLKVVKNGSCRLNSLGDLTADFEVVVKEATKFIVECYGVKDADTMTDARVKVWIGKMGKKSNVKMPKLCSLPPTTEAFKENVKRAHFQCAVWRNATIEPPDQRPTSYGWQRDESAKSLVPISLPKEQRLAPEYIMKIVCCACSSVTPCKTKACGCVSANLACTMFCNCQASSICKNKQTTTQHISDDDSDVDGY